MESINTPEILDAQLDGMCSPRWFNKLGGYFSTHLWADYPPDSNKEFCMLCNLLIDKELNSKERMWLSKNWV